MSMWRCTVIPLWLLAVASCATTEPVAEPVVVAPVRAPPPTDVKPPPRAPATRVAPPPNAVPVTVVRVSDAEVRQARQFVEQGTRLYREGQYDQAEDRLKQAINVYPFMADANLMLAKILLIRASASRDMTLYTNARLMLEMARALDPRSREIEQLLELVRQPNAD